MEAKDLRVGCIGQGWVGKHLADAIEANGSAVTRYALEASYALNKEAIADCDVVFIAVPTPSTPQGFDDSRVRASVALVGKGKIAVIKSTVVPGATTSIQRGYPDRIVLHAPEFLTEANAAHDAAHPSRNIIGVPAPRPVPRSAQNQRAQQFVQRRVSHSKHSQEAARAVLEILPKAPKEIVCSAEEAELIKYLANGFLYTKVVFANLGYDLAEALGARFDVVREGVIADGRIGPTHFSPVEKRGGRGAGGHCLIKDFAALADVYERAVGDRAGARVLRAIETKNKRLLIDSGKDTDLLAGVYTTEEN